jgi:hypothetical protein
VTWDEVLSVPGYSSGLIRRELNRACRGRKARILEVGSWHGSTAVAMCFANDVEYIDCVDNFSEFGGTAESLRETCRRFAVPATVHDVDLWSIGLNQFAGRTFNVYLYDGPHDEEHHARELEHMLPHLEHEFLYMVDDFSWPRVRTGCISGLRRLSDRLTVSRAIEYQSFQENDSQGFWNGMYMAWITQHGRTNSPQI